MPLSGSGLTSELESALSQYSSGTEFNVFCSALGNGIVNACSGIIMFTTADVGTIPGIGVGAGTGITGLVAANIQSQMYNTGQGFWSPFQNNGPGVEWANICSKVASTVKAHFAANATLTSNHTPVYVGVGTVVSYTGVTISGMKAAIVAASPGSWASYRMPELAEAVATGVVTEILSHSPTDTVTITGTPIGMPSPGTGSGSGVVT
jgi:hypothetical protein